LFGPLAPISSGGATSMDTTLPIITAVSGNKFAVLSVYHGFVVDLSVPLLVSLFCSL
ncbi:LysO family transporter, partial [uncultured Duncaniella sp.]